MIFLSLASTIQTYSIHQYTWKTSSRLPALISKQYMLTQWVKQTLQLDHRSRTTDPESPFWFPFIAWGILALTNHLVTFGPMAQEVNYLIGIFVGNIKGGGNIKGLIVCYCNQSFCQLWVNFPTVLLLVAFQHYES